MASEFARIGQRPVTSEDEVINLSRERLGTRPMQTPSLHGRTHSRARLTRSRCATPPRARLLLPRCAILYHLFLPFLRLLLRFLLLLLSFHLFPLLPSGQRRKPFDPGSGI